MARIIESPYEALTEQEILDRLKNPVSMQHRECIKRRQKFHVIGGKNMTYIVVVTREAEEDEIHGVWRSSL